MIWLAYCGYCCASASALENDLVSAAAVLSETFEESGDAAIAAANAEA